VETGDPFTTGSVQILGPDGGSIATVALDGVTGRWLYQANGQPGITLQEYTGAGQTRRMQGDAYGQVGEWMAGELGEMFRFFHDGCFPTNEPALSAPGGMNVRVGPGMILNRGILHPVYTNEDVAVTAAHATLPRIDAVVSRLTRTGTFAGRVVLAVVAGTAAATPAAPTLTQTADTWEVKLGEIAVAAAAGAITSGNLSTTGRRYAGPPGRRQVAVRTLTAVTEILIDDMFTADHRDYEVDIRIDSTTDNDGLYFQIRAARATVTTGVYDYTVKNSYGNSSSTAEFGDLDASIGMYLIDTTGVANVDGFIGMRIASPQRTRQTGVIWTSVFDTGSGTTQVGGFNGQGIVDTVTAYDGIRIYTPAGTMTGLVRAWAID
jgi:hypothetical protein